MWLAHNRHHSDPGSRSYRLGLEKGPQLASIGNWQALEDITHFGHALEFEFFGGLALEFGQIERIAIVVRFNQFLNNIRDCQGIVGLV